MTPTQLKSLKPNDQVTWNYDPENRTPSRHGIILSNVDGDLTILWSNGTTRFYKQTSIQMRIEQLNPLTETY
jgi:hypothetical protein